MAEIVNLNRFRKARKRAAEKLQAEANRTKFGRTKTEKMNDRLAVEKQERDLEGKKRDE
ncbi:MAG TPA: DUF4169 family protein [Terriglobia bacterium]|nr:DUF4169 family protein [Terriglobia bacterium]